MIVAVRDRAGDRYGCIPSIGTCSRGSRASNGSTSWSPIRPLPVRSTSGSTSGCLESRRVRWEPAEPARRLPAACLASLHIARDREEEVAGLCALGARRGWRGRFAGTRSNGASSCGSGCRMCTSRARCSAPRVCRARCSTRFRSPPSRMRPRSISYFRSSAQILRGCLQYRAVALAAFQNRRRGRSADSRRRNRGARSRAERGRLSWRPRRARPPRWSRGSAKGRASRRRRVVAPRFSARPRRDRATALGRSVAEHLDRVLGFLTRTREPARPLDDPLRARQLRARGAILGLLRALRDARRRFDSRAVAFDEVAAMVRRGIETQTFAPRSGERGVHLVDADSAPFGEFDLVQLAGLVDGEWPDRPRRNIFYSAAILRELGWPADADRLEGVRASFTDLLRLPLRELAISTFSLEHDSIVAPSILVDEIAGGRVWRRVFRRAPRPALQTKASSCRIRCADGPCADSTDRPIRLPAARHGACREGLFRQRARALPGLSVQVLRGRRAAARRAAGRRVGAVAAGARTVHPRSLSALLRSVGRARRRHDHVRLLDDARASVAEIAEPLLATCRSRCGARTHAAVRLRDLGRHRRRRARRRGVAAGRRSSSGWLEYRLEGEFALGAADGRRFRSRAWPIASTCWRATGCASSTTSRARRRSRKRALQVPIYALCAQERLAERDGGPGRSTKPRTWRSPANARSYRSSRPASDDQDSAACRCARAPLRRASTASRAASFRRVRTSRRICRYCAYPSVCRKDYVDDE